MKKIIYLSIMIIACVCFIGCGYKPENSKALINVNDTIEKVCTLVNKMENISSNTLIIKDFMNIKEITASAPEYNNDSDYNGATFTGGNNSTLTGYIMKLNNLNNVAYNSIKINNEIDNLKVCTLNKANYIKSYCEQILNNNCPVTNEQRTSLYDICNNILININRINLTKSELKTDINAVSKLKESYTNNIEQLTSKYTRLYNCFQTRTQYLDNILSCMDNLCLSFDVISKKFCYGDYNCESNYKEEKNAELQKASITPNIDTYENANKEDDDKNTNMREINNNNNYGQGYGYGGTNPYYNFGNMGGNNRGFGGGMNGFGYGFPFSPFSNYNPYMPNVDTYGSYVNTDSYHSKNRQRQMDNKEEDNDENIEYSSLNNSSDFENESEKQIKYLDERYKTPFDRHYESEKLKQNTNATRTIHPSKKPSSTSSNESENARKVL